MSTASVKQANRLFLAGLKNLHIYFHSCLVLFYFSLEPLNNSSQLLNADECSLPIKHTELYFLNRNTQ